MNLNILIITNLKKKKQKWFSQHPIYSTISTLCGTENLTKKITETFYHHIRKFLPVLD